nr:hypothetical protein [Tanacetum cinerariifolium]
DYSSSDDDSLYYENIEYVKASPHDYEFVSLESSSTSPKSVLEETTTFHNSLPEFENFCFDLKEISSGSTTIQSDISLPEYDSFIFDLSNDQLPPTDRSAFTHEGFGDEPGHIISPPEYDCFYFRDLPNSGELISSLNSRIRENLSSTTCVNLPVEDDYSPLLAYVVWIFLAYLTYPAIPPHLHSFENEDTVFDPGITINCFYSFKPGLSHRCGTFREFNTHQVEKIVIQEDEEIKDDNLREKLLKVNLLIAKIKALKDNPTPYSEFLTKSPSKSPKSFLEETNTFHNSLPKFENFYFDLEEISSGSNTTHSDISPPDYKAFSFYDDHIEEISSGSTTTKSDISTTLNTDNLKY